MLGTVPHNTQLHEGKITHLWSRESRQTWRARFSFSSHQGILSNSLLSLFAKKNKPCVSVQTLHLCNLTCPNTGLERHGPRQGPSAGLLIAQRGTAPGAAAGQEQDRMVLPEGPRVALPAATATLIPSAAAQHFLPRATQGCLWTDLIPQPPSEHCVLPLLKPS